MGELILHKLFDFSLVRVAKLFEGLTEQRCLIPRKILDLSVTFGTIRLKGRKNGSLVGFCQPDGAMDVCETLQRVPLFPCALTGISLVAVAIPLLKVQPLILCPRLSSSRRIKAFGCAREFKQAIAVPARMRGESKVYAYICVGS